MPLPTITEEILREHGNYIKRAAHDAIQYFETYKIQHFILDGLMKLTEKDCEIIYREMVIELCTGKMQAIHRYGMWAAILPKKKTNNDPILLVLCLGISFLDD